MLASRLVTILPPLTHEQAMEVAAIQSIAGRATNQRVVTATVPRRITRALQLRSSVVAAPCTPARSASRITAYSFSTSCQSSAQRCSKYYASRSKQDT